MFFVEKEARKLGNPEVGGTYNDNLVIPLS
jgi:hypothetical protein